jgi:chorismate-pyruvate lyase
MYVDTTVLSRYGDETNLEPIEEDVKSSDEESGHSFLQIAQLPFFSQLAPMQRVMLLSNGTLTDILQALTFEEIGIHKVAETLRYDAPEFEGEDVLERSVVLYGKRSSRYYLYAESLVALERLPRALARELREGSKPLGRLQLEHRLETFKELLDLRVSRSEKASE